MYIDENSHTEGAHSPNEANSGDFALELGENPYMYNTQLVHKSQPAMEASQLESTEDSAEDSNQLSEGHAAEIDSLIGKIGTLPETGGQRDTIIERLVERFQYIIDLHQEQPQLLDCKLPTWFDQLLGLIQIDRCELNDVNSTAFTFLAHMTKVRGEKVTLRLLPHEVLHLEPVLNFLQLVLDKSNRNEPAKWEVEYILLLWLSVLAKIPFDLSRFDGISSQSDNECAKVTTAKRMKNFGLAYLVRSDKTQNIAALVLANLLSRADVSNEELRETVRETLDDLKSLPNIASLQSVWVAMGKCQLLARILKHCNRADVLPAAPEILELFGSFELKQLGSSRLEAVSLRKMCIKILQRTGLVLLPTRAAAKWRYQRGKRRLEDTLAANERDVSKSTEGDLESQDEECGEIPAGLELVIERLLTALEDDTTVVRWSAAKGLGRVCNKLPRALADEVLKSLLDIFERLPDLETVWHGANLALAELARRGLILPENLDKVVAVICKALVFDRCVGTPRPLISASVRDAACYLCWSVARAFHPSELEGHVRQLAPLMTVVSVCDREVNVRRAASAAFQENVGRQRTFPHGIEIVTTVDYFAVGNRQRCYTQLCPFIAKFDQYVEVLVAHLVTHKVSHWDAELRSQAAQALALIADVNSEVVLRVALEPLVDKCTSVDVFVRHGSLLAVGYTAAVLYEKGTLQHSQHSQLLTDVVNIVKHVSTKNNGGLLVGAGGQFTKEALNVFVRELARVKVPLSRDDLTVWHQVICKNTEHPVDSVRLGSIEALENLFAYFAIEQYACFRDELLCNWLSVYLEKLTKVTGVGEIGRRGAALALGAVTIGSVPRDKLSEIIKRLVGAAADRSAAKVSWAEGTRDCVLALEKLVDKVYSSGHCLTRDEIGVVQACYTLGMQDYTRDRRGDIGRLVRDASIQAWVKFALAVCKDDQILDQNSINTGIGFMLQQCCGKINYTRVIACSQMRMLLQTPHENMQIAHELQLRNIFLNVAYSSGSGPKSNDQENFDEMHFWMSEKTAFERLIKLLECETYLEDALLGLVASAGGMGESTQRAAGESLIGYLSGLQEDVPVLRQLLTRFTNTLLKHQGVQRVVVPSLVVIDTLISSDCFGPFNTPTVDDEKWLQDLSEFVAKESLRKKCVKRVIAGISVMCSLLQFDVHSKLHQNALERVLSALTHVYPVVRRAAAEKLYEATLMWPAELSDDNQLDELSELLTDTQWDEDDVNVWEGKVDQVRKCFELKGE